MTQLVRLALNVNDNDNPTSNLMQLHFAEFVRRVCGMLPVHITAICEAKYTSCVDFDKISAW